MNSSNPSQSTELYLELLKRSLNFSLWPEPPIPASAQLRDHSRDGIKRKINLFIENLFKSVNRQIVKPLNYTDKDRLEGRGWSGYAHTMIGRQRLNNIQDLIKNILDEEVPGDFIEAGVWRGGATIFMAGYLKAMGMTDRRVYVADSFQGLPRPNPKEFPEDRGDLHYSYAFLSVTEDDVKENFSKYGLLDKNIVFLKGWFKDTLPSAPIEKLSLLRADGDMYESTHDILDNLYPKLSHGGYCIIDDYALPGCKKAVDDYRKKHNILEELIQIDERKAVYWKKE